MHEVLIAKRKCSDLWYFKVLIRFKHVDLINWEKNIAIYQRSFFNLIYDISYARGRRKIDSLCCQMLNVKLHV